MFKNLFPAMKPDASKSKSTGCILLAPIVILLGFFILFKGETFQRSSKVVEALPLQQASEVSAVEGTHKIIGQPVVTKSVTAPEVGEVIYYSYSLEEYKEVEEKETVTETVYENGQPVERERVETKIVEKWVKEDGESAWGEFKLGNYEIKPAASKRQLNLEEAEYRSLFDDYYQYDSSDVINPEIGDRRILVSYLPLTEDEVIVVGDIEAGSISGGEVFIVSNKSDGELLKSLETEETIWYWLSKAGAWLLLTIGMMNLFSPILFLTKWIPLAGKAVNSIASALAAFIAITVVIIGTVVIKYWWIVMILCGLATVGLAVGAYLLIKNKVRSSDGVKK